jgi:HEAT repeats
MDHTAERGAWSSLTPEAGLVERAALDDERAGAELVRRLTAGDAMLHKLVARPNDPTAERLRFLVLRYLGRGVWNGRQPPLAGGFHAGRECHHLRKLIAQVACSSDPDGWERTLLEGLNDADVVIRRESAHMLAGCERPSVVQALVQELSVRDEGVRWAAALALAGAGRITAEAVLRRLVIPELSPELRHPAAHVLRTLKDTALRQRLAHVVEALDASDYRVEAPQAANDALRLLSGRSASANTNM